MASKPKSNNDLPEDTQALLACLVDCTARLTSAIDRLGSKIDALPTQPTPTQQLRRGGADDTPTSETQSPTLTVKQAAKELQIGYSTTLKWIAEGKLPATDLTDGLRRPIYRICREDLDALLARGVDREALKARTAKPSRPTTRPAMPKIPKHF